jgi:hypothetical protein
MIYSRPTLELRFPKPSGVEYTYAVSPTLHKRRIRILVCRSMSCFKPPARSQRRRRAIDDQLVSHALLMLRGYLGTWIDSVECLFRCDSLLYSTRPFMILAFCIDFSYLVFFFAQAFLTIRLLSNVIHADQHFNDSSSRNFPFPSLYIVLIRSRIFRWYLRTKIPPTYKMYD